MAKLLDPESKPMLFLGGVWDAFVLHLIWIVCCIPVVTIGASSPVRPLKRTDERELCFTEITCPGLTWYDGMSTFLPSTVK